MNSHEKFASPYYPPRARWYRRLLSPWFTLCRLVHLEQVQLPGGLRPLLFLISVVVPGFSFFALGRRMLGGAVLATYGLAGGVFIIALGYPVAGISYGLIISLHATSLFYLELRWLEDSGFGLKVFLALATLLATWQLVYSPLLGLAGRYWFIPLRVRGNVVIVKPSGSVQTVRRGDWIVYRQPGARVAEVQHEGVYVQAGDSYGQVLAVAGDHVRFSTNTFTVNGLAHPLGPHMPTAGELVVPEKHWFVWPDFDIRGHGHVDAGTVSATLLQLAMVSKGQLMGKPYSSWCGRRQILRPGS